MAFTGFLRFWQTYKNIGRIRQIVNVFLKHGFGQFIEQINLHRFIPLRKKLKVFGRWPAVERRSVPERLRMAFSELGPSFIKLAQILSSRPDLITKEYADEFEKLQDKVPPFPAEEARRIIASELNISLQDVFSEFEDLPVAAASIAQVHRAALKNGEKVIIKVQRPNIREILETDTAILKVITRLMVKYIPESKIFNPEGIVDGFAKTVKKELDFLAEARHAQRFQRNFAGNPDICIPKVYTEFLSDKVIVMERFEGVRIDDLQGIDSFDLDRRELAKKGVDAYFKMILEDGFFHADPHPGNIFVMSDGRIGLMDFGIVGWLTPDIMETIAGAFLAFINKDFDDLVSQYMELGFIPEEVDIEVFRNEFKADLIEICEPLYDIKISEINFAEYIEILTEVAIKHGLRMPSALLLMDKTMLILDSVGRQLDPNFNFLAVAEPYAAKLVRKRLSPQRTLDKVRKGLTEMSEMVTVPKQINRLLRKTLKDGLGFKVDPIGMERLIKDIDRSSNRLAFSIIVAATIVGSSLLLQSGIGGEILGLPSVGAIGFLVAFILGLWLLISILKSGRL
ncbi:MAG: AarF/ABC1/UbiB kinase family protein [Nitrospiraceae bacterium]|nr:MAG: AarF/ABC1/UbiB kinase family protein [Nitrospiraceae bacterium]